MMQGRSSDQPLAATYSELGTDVNYGALTRIMIDNLTRQGAELNLQHEVIDLKRQDRKSVV